MERTLSDQDMVDILEEIARNAKNGAARIAAIKVLREIASGEPVEDAFSKLDGPPKLRAVG
ncbi:MAG TPA: hypothetical protein VFG14_14740 [Chthoniobacteraceae bacterium]|nr:hypothetical protein [Chthoniobacteraceae bacterium]